MSARLALVMESPDESEHALVRRAVDGDESAFEHLYHRHSGRVFALCLRMSGTRQGAAELTQDVFVHVWERLSSWRGESALSSWIHRLTVNFVLTAIRTDKRRRKYVMEADDDRSGGSGREATPHEPAVRPRSVEDAIDLENAIAALPHGARTVFVLHDVEGYRHEEIARLTGTAEGTCRAQLHRARQLLMEALDR